MDAVIAMAPKLLMCLALAVSLPACVGPRLHSEEPLANVLGKLTADGETDWSELRKHLSLSRLAADESTVPVSYTAKAALGESSLPSFVISAKGVPPSSSDAISMLRLGFSPEFPGAICIDGASLGDALGLEMLPVVPRAPVDGSPWAKLAKGTISGVEVSVVSTALTHPCIRYITLMFGV